MTLIERVTDEMKQAMRAKQKERLGALRLIRAGIIEEQKAGKGEVDDAAVVALMRRMVKQRADAAVTYRQGGREDLAAVEEAEVAVIEEFLPRLADEDTTRAWVETAVAASGATSQREMGKVMGTLMRAHKDEVDGTLARRLILEQLAG